MSSRPLRFVVLVLGGWVAMRTVQLWPVPDPIAVASRAVLEAVAPPVAGAPAVRIVQDSALPFREPRPVGSRGISTESVVRSEHIGPGVSILKSRQSALVAPVVVPDQAAVGPIGSPMALVSAAPARPRLRASLWTIVRGNGAASPLAPQLGGSQAGVRLTYALDDARRIALAGRLSTALGSRQREAALGVDWQPTALPIHLVAEQRIGIEGARGGPSVGVIAGLPPTRVAAGFALEAYGQTGGIARDGRVEGYADGAARLVRPVAAIGGVSVDIGVGAWGGAQRGAARIDVGPTASAAVPVAGTAVRVSLDWRQRIAGDARPGSGPAFSIGTDF